MPDLSYFPLPVSVRATIQLTPDAPQAAATVVAVEQESGMPTPHRYLVVLDEGGDAPLWVEHGKVLAAGVASSPPA